MHVTLHPTNARTVAAVNRYAHSPLTPARPEAAGAERTTTVANLRDHAPDPDEDMYIGRPSKWGNPYRIGRDGTRAQVIAKYHAHLMRTGLIDQVGELRGHTLTCWCAPEPCHGHLLAALADGRHPSQR